jgi:tRNA A-37 threonylcarbamoyl transferase component Bud32
MDETVVEAGFAERYELADVVGRGAAATVYRARDRRTDQLVAVKVYDAAVATVDRPQHRAELVALTRLRHPGLVSLYDAGFDEDRPYIAMKMVDGEPLSWRIALGPLPLSTVLDLGARLAETLAYVHARGVIHRDVKPSNILLDGGDRCFLTDFGVSRLIDATRCTASGIALGTPAFLAPEQVRGERFGPPIDVYALGLVLLEALTGSQEYPGGAVESAVARLHRAPQIPPTLPAPLRFLLRAMTAADPADRPDAAEVATRLAAVLAGDRAVEPTRTHLLVRGMRRHRWSLASLVVAVTAATMGTLALHAPPEPEPARVGYRPAHVLPAGLVADPRAGEPLATGVVGPPADRPGVGATVQAPTAATPDPPAKSAATPDGIESADPQRSTSGSDAGPSGSGSDGGDAGDTEAAADTAAAPDTAGSDEPSKAERKAAKAERKAERKAARKAERKAAKAAN